MNRETDYEVVKKMFRGYKKRERKRKIFLTIPYTPFPDDTDRNKEFQSSLFKLTLNNL